MPRLTYPAPPTSDQVDDYHGTRIADPYRPLEDANAPGTKAWIAAQNALTESVLEGVAARPAIRDRLAQLWDFPRASVPWRRGRRWFQLRNTGLQDQDVLWTAREAADEGRVLLDPNGLSATGTTALGSIAVSESGELAACALSDAGSDWWTWRVYDLETLEALPDTIRWAKFASAAWTHDDAGFFYGRYPEPPPDAALDAPNRDMQLRYHRLGTDAASDPIVFSTPHEPEWGFEPAVTSDGRTLVLSVWRGTDPENRIFVADVTGGVDGLVLRPLIDSADAHWEPIGDADGLLYFLTDSGAPLGRVIAIDPREPGVVREILAEGPDNLERAILVGGRLAAIHLHDAHHGLSIHRLDGSGAVEVTLPGLGTIKDAAGRWRDPDLYVAFETFGAPADVLSVDVATASVREPAPRTLPWNPDDFVTEQVFVTSGDGTRVPLFLTRRHDLVPEAETPTLLYGYGGFQIPIGPMFKAEWLAWMERGGLLAVASLRGGAEYGKAWHDAGRLDNKQQVFDDFAACLRWLAASGWTRRERIGIIGRSNGGLLVGATLTQHPKLFGAAIAEVGVMDMLRFHRFTIGWGWTSDYGSADDPDQFRTLLGYSPLHNCRPGVTYPATLVTTADHDDRVVPGHSFKFAATLQSCQSGAAPILIRVDTDAGHGSGKPVGKLIDERADVLTFLELALGAR